MLQNIYVLLHKWHKLNVWSSSFIVTFDNLNTKENFKNVKILRQDLQLSDKNNKKHFKGWIIL